MRGVYLLVFLLLLSGCVFGNSDKVKIERDGEIYESRLSIKSAADIIEKRSELIDYIWKDEGFPDRMPSNIEYNVSCERLSSIRNKFESASPRLFCDLPNLKSVDIITVDMEYGVNSVMFHLHPMSSNNNLIIFHDGHTYDPDMQTIKFYLARGYSVFVIYMPLYGFNNNPSVELKSGEAIRLIEHPNFTYIESKEFSPLKFFLEPVAIGVNYIKSNYSYDNMTMIGISGGAWTTTLYAAIDTRIKRSYVTGTALPFFILGNEYREYEDSLPGIREIADYLELYLMASYGGGRKYTQIFNMYDPSPYRGDYVKSYGPVINDRLSLLGGGEFEYYVDDTQANHLFSSTALYKPIDDIKNITYFTDKNKIAERLIARGYDVQFIYFGYVSLRTGGTSDDSGYYLITSILLNNHTLAMEDFSSFLNNSIADYYVILANRELPPDITELVRAVLVNKRSQEGHNYYVAFQTPYGEAYVLNRKHIEDFVLGIISGEEYYY